MEEKRDSVKTWLGSASPSLTGGKEGVYLKGTVAVAMILGRQYWLFQYQQQV